jgi:hypothetical protein
VDALAGRPKPSGDLGLADASGKQLSSAKPADFQLLMVNAVGRRHDVEPATHAQPIPPSRRFRQPKTRNPLSRTTISQPAPAAAPPKRQALPIPNGSPACDALTISVGSFMSIASIILASNCSTVTCPPSSVGRAYPW